MNSPLKQSKNFIILPIKNLNQILLKSVNKSDSQRNIFQIFKFQHLELFRKFIAQTVASKLLR